MIELDDIPKAIACYFATRKQIDMLKSHILRLEEQKLKRYEEDNTEYLLAKLEIRMHLDMLSILEHVSNGKEVPLS